MATRTRPKAKDLYSEDFHGWSKAQADERSVRSGVRTIIEHLLKLQYSPAQDPRPGWRATVRTQRVQLRDAITPVLRREVEAALVVL